MEIKIFSLSKKRIMYLDAHFFFPVTYVMNTTITITITLLHSDPTNVG